MFNLLFMIDLYRDKDFVDTNNRKYNKNTTRNNVMHTAIQKYNV